MSTHKMQVGTLCVVQRCATLPELNGERVVVVGLVDQLSPRGFPVYRVSARGFYRSLLASEDTLRPIYDGGTAVRWSECVWSPHRIKLQRKVHEDK